MVLYSTRSVAILQNRTYLYLLGLQHVVQQIYRADVDLEMKAKNWSTTVHGL